MKTSIPDPNNERTPVKDPVKMFAVRMIGRNVPHTEPTYFEDEAEGWLVPGSEIVAITILPYEPSTQ
ncbi:MAG: hypothetical protein M0R32_05765 [Candidatus Cloacimonetes bacterium]|jgi:hypothetical protein|nr:hypothetical protein [Candidatus Cloacimonadota bacterium]